MNGTSDDFQGLPRGVSTGVLSGVDDLVKFNPIPIERALAALHDVETDKELADRLSVVMTMLWSDVAKGDLLVPHPSGDLRSVRNARTPSGPFPTLAASAEMAAQGILPLHPRVMPAERSTGRGSAMSAPLFSGVSLEALLVVTRRGDAPEFTSHDVDALKELADGVRRILQRTRTRGGRSLTAAWAEHDLAAARELQRAMLPSSSAANSAGVRAFSAYLPAFAVGGDFYDFVDLGGGRVMAAIGDVSGKGVTAALMMARLTGELRRLAGETSSPAELMRRLNQSLAGQMQDHKFATMVCVLLDMPNQRWVVSNAGHVLPILRRGSGWVSLIAQPSGSPIGISPTASYQETVYPALSRDIVILTTDGALDVLSGRRGDGSIGDSSRLILIIETGPHDVGDLGRRIISAVESAVGDRDDVALLGLQLPG